MVVQDALIFVLAATVLILFILGGACGLYYCFTMRKVSKRLQSVASDLELYLEKQKDKQLASRTTGLVETDCVPPLAIHLEKESDPEFWQNAGVSRFCKWFQDQEFSWVGDYVIEEMADEHLRIFLDTDRRLISALRYPHYASEPYAEFCFKLLDGSCAGVANPPEHTLLLPEEALGKFFSEKLSENRLLLDEMHQAAECISQSHGVVQWENDDVPLFYEESHAAEMDLRMRRGGLSVEEIERTFSAYGAIANAADIHHVQSQWQDAIEKHLIDFSSHAMNLVVQGQLVFAVHDGSEQVFLVEKLQSTLSRLVRASALSNEINVSAVELKEMLTKFSPREAIARFRPLLPSGLRYELVDQISRPLPADLYVLPEHPSS